MAKESKILCPVCGRSVVGEPEKNWQYGIYKVKRYKCEYGHLFNLYESEKRIFTIPKAKVSTDIKPEPKYKVGEVLTHSKHGKVKVISVSFKDGKWFYEVEKVG